jgi:hypothetical protein
MQNLKQLNNLSVKLLRISEQAGEFDEENISGIKDIFHR